MKPQGWLTDRTRSDSILDSNDPRTNIDAISLLPSGKSFSRSAEAQPYQSSTSEVETKTGAMSDQAARIFRALTQHPNLNVREITWQAIRWQASGIGSLELPSKIEALYPMAFDRLALYLQNLDGDYPSDHEHKDREFVTGASVPVTRSHSVDLASRIGYRASFVLIAALPRWRYAYDLFAWP